MESLGQSQKREAITWIIGLPILYLLIVKSFAIDAPNPDSFVEVSAFAKEMPKIGIFAIFASILALVQAIDGKQVISKGRTWAILTLIVFAIIPYTENHFRVQEGYRLQEIAEEEQRRMNLEAMSEQSKRIGEDADAVRENLERSMNRYKESRDSYEEKYGKQ